tara:strand:- start:2458 stop:3825 length:1368 start_codon:yes stop_codon:yes gene_type:complete
MSEAITKLNEKLEGLGFLRKLGDVDPRVFDGIKKGLKDFPEPFLEDFLESKYQIVVATPQAWEATMRRQGHPDAFIERFKKSDGYTTRLNSLESMAFNKQPTIVLLQHDDNIDKMNHRIEHESGHAFDHIEAGYEGFISDKPSLIDAFEKYMESGVIHRRVDESEVKLEEHLELYGPHFGRREAVAEMIQKFSERCKVGYTQFAERTMATDFPFIWDALKQEMPQIGKFYKKHGLDINARPLHTTPQDILTHEHLHRALEGGDFNISVHGLSVNEIDNVRSFLQESGFNPRDNIGSNDKEYSFLVVPSEEAERFRSMRDEMIKSRQEKGLEDPEVLDEEEFRITKEFLTQVRNRDLFKSMSLARDGGLILNMSEDYDLTELGQQVGIPDLSESDRITTSSPDTKTLAVAFNRLPQEFRSTIISGFNNKSGFTEQQRTSAQKHKPKGAEGEEMEPL